MVGYGVGSQGPTQEAQWDRSRHEQQRHELLTEGCSQFIGPFEITKGIAGL